MTSLQPYKKYHPVSYDYVQSLPDGWKLLPNLAIFQERIERGYENEELLSVTIGRGVIKQSELEKKDSSTLDKSKYLLVCPDDLVYSMRFRQGASGYSDYKGIVSPACTVLRPKKDVKINSRFYYYMFRTGFYKNYVERFAYGIADGQIPLRYIDFKRMYSIFPPLEVQNSIVEYLDKKNSEIDKFIENKEKLIELLEEQKKRKIVNVITTGLSKQVNLTNSGIEWFGSIPSHWLITKAKFISKIFIPDRNKPELNTNDGIPWVTTELIGREILDINLIHNFVSKESGIITGNRTLPKNSVIANCIGTFGCSSYVLFECLINQQLQAYTDIKINPFYLRFIIQISETYFNRNATQTTLMYVNKQVFSELPILFPPLDEQNQIVDFITKETTKIDLAISKAQKEIELIKQYREALITDLVTGKRSIPQT